MLFLVPTSDIVQVTNNTLSFQNANFKLQCYYYYYYYSRNMVFKGKNGSKTGFHRNGLLATLGSNFQEGQN